MKWMNKSFLKLINLQQNIAFVLSSKMLHNRTVGYKWFKHLGCIIFLFNN